MHKDEKKSAKHESEDDNEETTSRKAEHTHS
jgi:hypothetical protein